jgi:hypothetical protein
MSSQNIRFGDLEELGADRVTFSEVECCCNPSQQKILWTL